MKRVYKVVETRPADGGWGVALDGRPVRTPARRELAVPSERLAAAIAAEWDAQHPDDPARDRCAAGRGSPRPRSTVPPPSSDKIVAEVANYAGTGISSAGYRADAPRRLAALDRKRCGRS